MRSFRISLVSPVSGVLVNREPRTCFLRAAGDGRQVRSVRWSRR